jgi:hypothetical protein
VPGLPGDDRVERPAGEIPRLEGRHLDLDPGPHREVGHPRVGLHPEHLAAGREELPRRDTGTASQPDVVQQAPG